MTDAPLAGHSVPDKGLRKDAIGFVSNVVIGISSTAPAYSLASALGLVAASAAFATPSVLILTFIPMLFLSLAFLYMNRADPDCGTTFSWATRAIGPHTGWFGGWGIIVTDIIVMPSLAVIAGQYSFRLFGIEPSTFEVTAVGVGWIVLMTAICYFGIELSARTQRILLGIELVILALFAAVALVKVYSGTALPEASRVSLSWFNPFTAESLDGFTTAFLISVFIYWGWDTGLAVNEETQRPDVHPGRAAVVATVVLVGTYTLVAVAAIAFAGPELLAKNSDDIFAPIGVSVLGPGLDKLLILAVLTSASAATQTTVLPAVRTAVSMAHAGALPRRFGQVHPRHLSPHFTTVLFGAVSVVWYVGLTALSPNVLADSIKALGLCIAFYYALTGVACIVFYRHRILRDAKSFILIGLLPALGTLAMVVLFIKSCFDLGRPTAGQTVILGVGGPLVIGIGTLLSGFVVMVFVKAGMPDFFTRKPHTLAGAAPAAAVEPVTRTL